VHLAVRSVSGPAGGRGELEGLLRAWHPNILMLAISGQPEDTLRSNGALCEEWEYLAKPFSADELARRVRKLLDRDRARRVSGERLRASIVQQLLPDPP
jgi:DNA-binding response OmpR family regulator